MQAIKKIIVILSMCAIVLITIASFNSKSLKESDGIEWTGEQDISVKKTINYIAVPGFTRMTFVANQRIQKVNLYNPDENDCIMQMRIEMSDNTVLWQSDSIQPGYGFYEIELAAPLETGIYDNCQFFVRCFDKTGAEINGGNIQFTLYVY